MLSVQRAMVNQNINTIQEQVLNKFAADARRMALL